MNRSCCCHAVLLPPFELTNKADPTKRNGANGKDTPISFMTSGSDTSINTVAWIAAHDPNNNDAPRMPHLVASSGSMAGVNVCWKLQVTFHDKNGNPHRDFDTSDPNDSNTSPYLMVDPIVTPSWYTADTPDQVSIPDPDTEDAHTDDGWHIIWDGTPWDISQDPDFIAAVAQGFFGGDAVLSIKIEKSDGTEIMPQQDYKFRIAGENPDPAKCKTFINSVCGNNWFAYAIAKEETNGEGGRTSYNQFLENGGGGVTKTTAWPGHEGRPCWNNDSYYSKKKGQWITTKGSGGYGLFQLTYRETIITSSGRTISGDANYIMPRDWIWNWQSNTNRGIVDLNGKASSATNLYNWIVANFGSSIQSQRCPTSGNDIGIFNAYEGILVCLNNGSDGFNLLTKPGINGKYVPWGFDANGNWIFTGTYAIKVAGFVE